VVELMEAAVADGKTEAEYRFGSWTYTVFWHDPDEMAQMNMSTGTLRPVRRRPPLPSAEPASAAAEEEEEEAGETRDLPPWLGAEDDKTLSALLLSPASSTEKPPAATDDGALALLTDEQLLQLLQRHVPGVDGMLDRTGQTPIHTYIIGTYRNGLPIYQGSAPLQAHCMHALRSVFAMAAAGKDGAAAALQAIAAAYQACQAEQGRTIDAQFGRLSGRDATFKEQLLALVDWHKHMVMQQVVLELNPGAAEVDDGRPSQQAPHITSAYLQAVGGELGFRGVEAAKADTHAPPLAPSTVANVRKAIRKAFSVQEVVESIVGDVNQQHADAERVISRDDLAKWVVSSEAAKALAAAMEAQARGSGAAGGDAGAPSAFDPHSVFFDEASSDAAEGAVGGYGDSRPSEENTYQPFLCPRVAVTLLLGVMLQEDG
jgi:hypothetical protein